MSVTIYHNPRCSKSRTTMALLEERNVNPDIIEYLKNPPSEAELEQILTMLGKEPEELMRKGEDEYRQSIKVNWIPFLLPQLMQMSGNTPPTKVRNKGLYLLRDLKRWATYLDVPLVMQKPVFFDARPALVAAQALNGTDRERFSIAMFNALWSGNIRPDHDGWVGEVMEQSDLPAEWAAPDHPEQCMIELRENTRAAYKAGAFGAPTFILKGTGKPQLFWGADRLDFLSQAIAASTG